VSRRASIGPSALNDEISLQYCTNLSARFALYIHFGVNSTNMLMYVRFAVVCRFCFSLSLIRLNRVGITFICVVLLERDNLCLHSVLFTGTITFVSYGKRLD
jgi:hypothetical protein